jgi:hypothetical protein
MAAASRGGPGLVPVTLEPTRPKVLRTRREPPAMKRILALVMRWIRRGLGWILYAVYFANGFMRGGLPALIFVAFFPNEFDWLWRHSRLAALLVLLVGSFAIGFAIMAAASALLGRLPRY